MNPGSFLRMMAVLATGAVAGCDGSKPEVRVVPATRVTKTELAAPAAVDIPAPVAPVASGESPAVAAKTQAPVFPKGKTVSVGPIVKEERVGNLIVRSSETVRFGVPALFFRKGDQLWITAQTEEERKAALEAESVEALFALFRWTPERVRELIPGDAAGFTGSLTISYEKQEVARAITKGRIAPAPAVPP